MSETIDLLTLTIKRKELEKELVSNIGEKSPLLSYLLLTLSDNCFDLAWSRASERRLAELHGYEYALKAENCEEVQKKVGEAFPEQSLGFVDEGKGLEKAKVYKVMWKNIPGSLMCFKAVKETVRFSKYDNKSYGGDWIEVRATKNLVDDFFRHPEKFASYSDA